MALFNQQDHMGGDILSCMYDISSAADGGMHANLLRAAAENYGYATALERRAERCRVVAEVLEVRRAALVERHRPVMELHTETVWKGRAATANREHLMEVTNVSLQMLASDLAATRQALLGEAANLTSEAAAVRRRALAAESAAAQLHRQMNASTGQAG